MSNTPFRPVPDGLGNMLQFSSSRSTILSARWDSVEGFLDGDGNTRGSSCRGEASGLILRDFGLLTITTDPSVNVFFERSRTSWHVHIAFFLSKQKSCTVLRGCPLCSKRNASEISHPLLLRNASLPGARTQPSRSTCSHLSRCLSSRLVCRFALNGSWLRCSFHPDGI